MAAIHGELVTLAGASVVIADQIMRQEAAEQFGPFACAVREDARHQAAVVVIKNRHRHAPEEGEGVNVTIDPGFSRRRRIRPDITGIAVRQIEGKVVGLSFDTTDDNHRLAEVGLRMAWPVRQWHEHLAPPPFALSDVILHNGVAAGEPMLIA